MSYSPFPERELLRLAEEYVETANRFGEGSKMRAFYQHRADMLNNAVACHEALRERCLVAEMDRDQARRIAS